MLCVLTWSYIVNNDPDRLYRYDLHLMHGSGRGSVVVRREVRAASVGSACVVHYFGRDFRGGEGKRVVIACTHSESTGPRVRVQCSLVGLVLFLIVEIEKEESVS